MTNKNIKWTNAIITGASSGIGLEFAYQLAKQGTNLLLIARNFDKLISLKNDLESNFGIKISILELDLLKSESNQEILKFIDELDFKPDLLINNAGAGLYGKFEKTNINLELDIISLNITALTKLTKSILDIMKEQGLGTILNVSSTMAFRKSPNWSVYAATKSYVLSFTRSLSLEYEKTSILISLLCPGKTLSGFDINANALSSNERKSAVTSKVVEFALSDLAKGKTMIIPGINNKVKYYVYKYFPDFINDKIVRCI
jgi:uncharacterized protein